MGEGVKPPKQPQPPGHFGRGLPTPPTPPPHNPPDTRKLTPPEMLDLIKIPAILNITQESGNGGPALGGIGSDTPEVSSPK